MTLDYQCKLVIPDATLNSERVCAPQLLVVLAL